MFDEESDVEDQFAPPHSIAESEYVEYEHESVIEGRERGQCSPPQSIIEEVYEGLSLMDKRDFIDECLQKKRNTMKEKEESGIWG